MAITRSVKQQYEYYVAVKSGVLDETNCLMHTAVLNENADKVVRGSVISLNAAGEFVLGLTEGSGNLYPMPCFAKKNAFDPDVMTGAVGSATGEVIASSTVGKRCPPMLLPEHLKSNPLSSIRMLRMQSTRLSSALMATSLERSLPVVRTLCTERRLSSVSSVRFRSAPKPA